MIRSLRKHLRSWLAQHPDPLRQRLGRQSERLAARLLASQGYEVERTNVRFPVGEIDVVAWEEGVLCFIEVRSTHGSRWGGPLASITERKQRRLIRAARWYLSRVPPPIPETRFDVVGIEWSASGEPRVELVRGAFDAS